MIILSRVDVLFIDLPSALSETPFPTRYQTQDEIDTHGSCSLATRLVCISRQYPPLAAGGTKNGALRPICTRR